MQSMTLSTWRTPDRPLRIRLMARVAIGGLISALPVICQLQCGWEPGLRESGGAKKCTRTPPREFG